MCVPHHSTTSPRHKASEHSRQHRRHPEDSRLWPGGRERSAATADAGSGELLLGAARYGFELGCWSAGCVIAEMCAGRPLFSGGSQIDTLLQIFQLPGTPSCTNWPQGTQLHHFRDTFPKWPGTGLQLALDMRPGLYAHERARAPQRACFACSLTDVSHQDRHAGINSAKVDSMSLC